jgi:hypothetical protein
MSNIHFYDDIVLCNVRSILWAVKERGGLVPNTFIEEQERKYRGEWSADCVNIALVAMGKRPAYEGKSSPRQFEIFVQQAKERNAGLLHEIAELRAAKGK